MLLASARHLLGRVVRDADAVRPLASRQIAEPAVLCAAVVALRLLTEAPASADLESVVPGEPPDVAAALLALVMVTPATAAMVAKRVAVYEASEVARRMADGTRLLQERGRLLGAVG